MALLMIHLLRSPGREARLRRHGVIVKHSWSTGGPDGGLPRVSRLAGWKGEGHGHVSEPRGRRRPRAGRLGRPEEVADLAAAVLRNAYLTNQVIGLDGGMYPR